MKPKRPIRYCLNDTCGNEIAPDQIYCSGDCRLEHRLRMKADAEAPDWRDRPSEEPSKEERATGFQCCLWCGGRFEGTRHRYYCSAACKVAAWRKGLRPSSEKAKIDRFSILERDGFRCRYCGRTAREDAVKLHVDHIIPLSKGGIHSEGNLVTACQECNLGKHDRKLRQLPP